ncbi:unnamed protein product (macronuclear) [Paramecium tetraurelia]|uniref:Casein kinase I n=1 Tax=Paramecium tetraurelia TaxID=5888 RepID=A0ECC9_PARTE|nr:uncharacterized protein GSPATT00025683001 [Paramecium tetraurelia]CAK92946.1 unnamed protein product [Paramecium tetraurelia]|eukprot:XP_001460343.1 hypothetical protein (macronuclear) [Paramecium tetraurelia strain d4-2]
MQTASIFNGIYVVQKKISSGSFGVVLLGQDKERNVDVAIKIEKEENEDVRSLEREVQVLERLQGTDGVPKLLWHGQQDEYNVIILQLLGKDLSHFMKTKKKFSFKTTIQLGIQIVHVLERIHNKGVVHRDLKPENILFGIEDESSKIYVVDFGISKIYRDAQGNILPFRDNASFIGTTRYASIAAHKGHELSRKDDIESLIYVLLYFMKGQLPWQNMQNVSDEERTVKVGEMKMNMDPRELCKDVPIEFAKILEYLKQLQYNSDPNYYFVYHQFEKAAENQGIQLDNIFDWDQQQQMKISQSNNENIDNLQRSNTQQQLQPPQSTEMKKSIEKQGSNLIRQLSNNQFLIPPSQLKRQDSQQPSVVSGSVMLSTYNSIRPKYQASQMAFDIKVCDDNSPQDINQNMKQTAETGNQNGGQNSCAETVCWKDSVFEENFEEIPLAKKYGMLKQKGVEIPKKRKTSQSPIKQRKKN